MSAPSGTKVLRGRKACGGFARGRPVIVHGPSDLAAVRHGDVLVARETDMAYVPAMQRAAAIVTEQGGRFCHAAVWARENNKPTVVQAANATVLLQAALNVDVNADDGTVEWDQDDVG